jgi:hypothetical protein
LNLNSANKQRTSIFGQRAIDEWPRTTFVALGAQNANKLLPFLVIAYRVKNMETEHFVIYDQK